MKRKKGAARLLCILLAAVLCGTAVSAAGAEECTVCATLRAKGFPESYRTALCALKLDHPNWDFEVLNVTALSREKGKNYDFPYVVEEEWQVAGRSLVSARKEYTAYVQTGSDLYDSGFYRANRGAVAYFMDPRNFLSEEGIFQFLILTGGSDVPASEVEKLLQGCAALSAAKDVPGGLAEFLVQLGKECDINPLQLATRLRQEQGSEGNALLTGTVGSYLGGADKHLDGYYNPYNLSASGKGEGQIYRSGAEYARSKGWDSQEKGLRGGAEQLAQEYVGKYQNTLYLQKWNVDPRSEGPGGSRNFWAQYMQNIGAAKTEGDFLAQSLAETSAPLHFLIPVYEEMPEAASPDPAGGTCAVFADAGILESRHLYPAIKVAATFATTTIPVVSQEKEERSVLPLVFTGFAVPAGILAGILLIRGKKEKNLSKIPKK
ncbi:MAG: hypothetical protein E7580_00435 [Ruminococcaceae bacterium]|nr:hypothetical protein [Oscillospiraceae bacterium]